MPFAIPQGDAYRRRSRGAARPPRGRRVGGPGIPSHERINVFRRLYRLERARTTPGSGLGLSLVAAIAELHGARMSLTDNKPGLGIEVSFPRA